MSQFDTKFTDPLRRDALAALNLTRTVKNVLFLLLLLSLLALGGAFWITDITRWQNQSSRPETPACETIEIQAPDDVTQNTTSSPREITPPAAEVASPVESVAVITEETATRNTQWRAQLAAVLAATGRFGAFFSGLIFLLTLLMMINLSIVGRLGGAADITRAFFLMLLAFILMVPWRSLVLINFPGALFRYKQLLNVQCGLQTAGDAFCYYLHYVGLWAGVLLLVIAAQWRSRQGVNMIKNPPSSAPTLTPPSVTQSAPVQTTSEPIPLEPSP
ncbi:MAG: hypothetical protein JW709_04810 [Sedimentisphaerales bacterium]|nr:hypothetical protein [Sedimentisphaerales bacterium]